MANRIYTPYLNPIHVVELNATAIPQYVSKHQDDFLFNETIPDFMQQTNYIQKWLRDDAIRLQYATNYSPVVFKLFRCDGSEVYSANFDTRQEDEDNPGFFIRQIDIDLSTYDVGQYYIQVQLANPVSLILQSEPFEICESFDNSLYIEYSHFEKRGGIWFQSPFSPTIRIPGLLKYNETESIDTIYPDQDENEEILHSTPYRVWTLSIGGARGIPPWLKDKLSRILGCSDVKIDGRYYTKSDGAKWEAKSEVNYPMRGYSIDLRERYNRDSEIYDNDAVLRGIAVAGLFIGNKGFGIADQTGEDYLEINSLI